MTKNAKIWKPKQPNGYKSLKVTKICAIREDVENRGRNLCSLHMTIMRLGGVKQGVGGENASKIV